ncbi:MAG: hypothetical protein IH616_15925 [Gemmatimonadales bacterium]|nr:hypothetical protein [Gemmatimonadales bacterium]
MSTSALLRSSAVGRLAWPVYCVAVTLIVLPLVDLVANVWPFAPAEAAWRYGTLGLFSGFLLTPLLGFLMAVLMAAHQGHRVMLRTSAWILLAAAVACLACVVLFALDVLQVRASVPAEARTTFDIGAAKAELKYLAVSVALVWLWVGGRRAACSSSRRGRSTEPGPQVVARQP